MRIFYPRLRFPGISFLLAALFAVGLCSLYSCQQATKPAEKPNILFIFIDDMGWPSIGAYGNEYMETPHMDRLAAEGMRFTDAYVTPQCTPSRASLLTGQHTARNQMWHVVPYYGYPQARMLEPVYLENLPRESYTMAEALQDNGYRTAILGKWHLHTYENDGYYTRLWDSAKVHYGFDYVDQSTGEYQAEGDKGVDMLTDEAIAFMERNRGEKPFFIYLSHHTLHGPILAPDSLVEKYRQSGFPEEGQQHATYLASIEHLDNSIGRLLAAMEEMEILDRTAIFFLTDNGGVDRHFDNAPLRAGKGSAYEGGIRVPFMVRYPPLVEAGSVSEEPVHVVDMYPTLVELAGGRMGQEPVLDGMSLLPLLRGQDSLARERLYWYMPLYDPQWGATPAAVIRRGDYKLIKSFGDYIDLETGGTYIPEGRIELYDLENDLSESHDLAPERPDLARELETELDAWLEEIGVELPRLNPDYDPEKALERNR